MCVCERDRERERARITLLTHLVSKDKETLLSRDLTFSSKNLQVVFKLIPRFGS